MAFILTTFFTLTIILIVFLFVWLYKKLPKGERHKLVIPILIAAAIGIFCFLMKWKITTGIGRFL